MRNSDTVWLTRTVPRTAPDRLERSDLEMIVVVPLCKIEDDERKDGERHVGDVVLMDEEMIAGKRWKWKDMSSLP